VRQWFAFSAKSIFGYARQFHKLRIKAAYPAFSIARGPKVIESVSNSKCVTQIQKHRANLHKEWVGIRQEFVEILLKTGVISGVQATLRALGVDAGYARAPHRATQRNGFYGEHFSVVLCRKSLGRLRNADESAQKAATD
jgi:hypothetical protein